MRNTHDESVGVRDPAQAEGAARPSGDGAGTSALEGRYRRLLGILPRPYRAVREDEMVATFLAAERDADPDNFDLALVHGAPSWRETRSVAALALRLRFADPVGPPRYRLRLGALRTALFGYLVPAAVDAVFGLASRIALAVRPLADGGVLTATRLPVSRGVEAWIGLSTWSFLAWIAVLPLALAGGRAAMSTATVLAAVPTVVGLVAWWRDPGASAWWLVDSAVQLIAVVLLAGLAAVRSSVAIRTARRWLVGAGVATGLLVAIQVVAFAAPRGWETDPPRWLVVVGSGLVDEQGLWAWAVVIAGGVAAARAWRGTSPRADSMLGLLYLAVALLVVRAATGAVWIQSALDAQRDAPGELWLLGAGVAVVVQILALAVVVVGAGLAVARARRLLPPVSYGI